MDDLFSGTKPDAALADRAIQKLRTAPLPRRRPGMLAVKIMAGVAAMLLLAVLGGIVQGYAGDGELPFPGLQRRLVMEASAKPKSQNFLKQLTSIFNVSDLDDVGKDQDLKEGREVDTDINHMKERTDKEAAFGTEYLSKVHGHISHGPNFSNGGGDVAEKKSDFNKQHEKGRESGMPIAGDISPEEITATPPPAFPSTEGRQPADDGKLLENSRNATTFYAKQGKHLDIPVRNNSFNFSQPDSANKSPRNYFNAWKDEQEPANTAPPLATDKTSVLNLDYLGVQEKKEVSKETGIPPKSEAPPSNLARKIIRTGTLDFEIDAFDAAVENVSKLIANIKGAFVATVNSDKLPNGKMRGSVVVRMPPAALDKFILDLRRDLTKTGDLKSQKIGSQDITKQYTDVESRLRAARSMEERLLNIIKTGKGEIKDLVAAERELGVWRTKIEEMEGEIRYYGNQVSLSTLTINLTEKEIQAPSALVVTEKVGLRIEVENVKQAHQATLKAVEDAKGRVTKSELKQHAAGQLEAVVHAEVAPKEEEKFRAGVEKLGIVRHQDAQQTQQAEGGSGKPQELKPRYKDIHFEITLYNSANIQPRETFTMQIATLDVPGGYHKLREEVIRAKGQIRVGQLKEQDKLNTVAQFDFDIPAGEKARIDKIINEVGPIFSRSNSQVPVTEIATDKKVGYRLVIRNVAGMPARETITMKVEVNDVDAKAAKMIDLVRASQGVVTGSNIDRSPNGATATLDFDVPLSAQEALVEQFKSAGVLRHQQATRNPQVPVNDLATAHFSLTLTSAGSIIPSEEGLWPQIRKSLYVSFKVLSWSLMLVILGLCVILPWALVIWVVVRLGRKMWGKPSAASV